MSASVPPLCIRRGSIEIARSGRGVIVSNVHHKNTLLVEQADFDDFVEAAQASMSPQAEAASVSPKPRKRLMRVRRIVEYVGDPEVVTQQLARSMKEGDHVFPITAHKPGIRITVAQLGAAEFVDGDDSVTVAVDAKASTAS